jgi:hypothetical protein
MQSRNPRSPENRPATLVMVLVCALITGLAAFGVISKAEAAAPAGTWERGLTLSLPIVTTGDAELAGDTARVPDPGSPAPHLEGCKGKYRILASDWNQRTIYFEIVALPRPHSEERRVAHTAINEYWDCPDGDRPRKAMTFRFEYCHFLPELGRQYDGTWYNAYLYNSSGKEVNPPRFLVGEGPRDSHYQNCRSQVVPRIDREWMKVRSHPRWNVWSQNRREGALPDESRINWQTDSGEVMFLHPTADIQITDWQHPAR